VTDDLQANIILGTDKGYDAQDFIDALQDMNVIPYVAQNTSGRCSAVPDAIAATPGYAISIIAVISDIGAAAIAATPGYAISIHKRKRIKQVFGWAKTIEYMRQG